MRINFVLPGFSPIPIGGYKVVYRYANAMAERGHIVRVIHPPWCNIKDPVSPANYLRQQVKILAGPMMARRMRDARVSWFDLLDKVEQVAVPDLRERYIPDSDATIATAWTTAPWVASYSKAKGTGYYLIQHYEEWGGFRSEVDKTWRLPLHKIVIAKWLAAKAAEFCIADQTTYIANGIDFDVFRLTQPIENREPRICMMGHKADWKGMGDGIRALEIVHGILPKVRATVFGTDARPDMLPPWIIYVRLPSAFELTELYNSSSVFLHPSWSEGLPAPPAEAMACGAALVAAANAGVMDFATDDETALLAAVKDPDGLAKNLLRFFKDEELRVRIATQGRDYILTQTWTSAEEKLEQLLRGKTL